MTANRRFTSEEDAILKDLYVKQGPSAVSKAIKEELDLERDRGSVQKRATLTFGLEFKGATRRTDESKPGPSGKSKTLGLQGWGATA